jgi:predicted RND superfamily exporter protein
MHGLTKEHLAYHKTAILLSAVTLLVTVGSMLLAVHPAIRSVGFSTLVGLLAAIILSYVVQPAVFRWLHRKKQ